MNVRKIAAFAIGPIGGALLGFITLPMMTWFFSPEDIGRVSMLQVTVSFGIMLFSLGLDQAYVREYHESANTPLLLKNTLAPGLILLCLVASIFLFAPQQISRWLFEVESGLLGSLVIICMLSAFVSRFLSLILRMQEKGLAFSMSQLLPKVIFLALIAIYIILDTGFTTVKLIAAHTISILLVCLIYAWNTRGEWLTAVRKKFDAAKSLQMLRYSIPLIFGGLAYWGLTAVDKVFIRALSSYEELGVYSVAVSFAAAAAIFQSVFTTVWAPTVYKWVGAGESLDKVQKVTSYVLFIVVVIFCLAGLFSWLIDYILPATYENVKYIVVACLGSPLLYTLSETTVVGIGVTRKTMYALAASVIALISNLVGNYLLIPQYGAAGAAASTCFSFWVFFVCRTEFSILVWKKIPRFSLYLFTLLCVLLASATSILSVQYMSLISVLWLGMFIIALISFRRLIMETMLFVIHRNSDKGKI